MKKSSRILTFVCFFPLFTVFFASNANAYLDPAATSYIVQIVAGISIACCAAVGVFWKKIRLFFEKQKIKNMENRIAREAEKKQNASKL